jgi:hypothetical protein
MDILLDLLMSMVLEEGPIGYGEPKIVVGST